MSDQHEPGVGDPTPLECLRAVVSDMTPIHFTATCEIRGASIVVTLTKEHVSREVTLPAEFQDADSQAITEALQMPLNAARLEIEKSFAPPKRKAKKAKKRKKAKRKSSTPSAAGRVPAEDSEPVSSEPSEPATAAPTTTTTEESTDAPQDV